jgi:hypothetical protein
MPTPLSSNPGGRIPLPCQSPPETEKMATKMMIGGDRGDSFYRERSGDEAAPRACSDGPWEDEYDEIDGGRSWRR